ncbi:outer membrane beta-barrel protein [Hymenobacter sp. 15J16-1T3B]|uniref:outer membrane beta-barrel protein n=1 Tax=Hymenobacter sp. 15J16-1T3B TaxID=2886941 RepID=UPI001D1294C8|nr:outer membrane beta-barrel protein [Hymenobacter sp. 15J16-1T3B]MCC3159631.1 outer membrane beta-barrel protein [Hymenobacter sp. 15J16-1T3B]
MNATAPAAPSAEPDAAGTATRATPELATTAAGQAQSLTRWRADEAGLGSLTSSLLLAPGAGLPTPLPPPAGPRDSLRRLRPARLSLGLLLGTALPSAQSPRLDSSNRLPLRHLPGVSAELAARYRLSRTLALRGGVGYAQQRQEANVTVEKRQAYWGRTTQLIVRDNPTGPDTLQLVSYGLLDSVVSRQRQRYQLAQQYLTLPLAAEWHPRTPFVRWQPVLGLGATTSWLLRGSYITTDDGCNCQQKTQRRAGAGPFAPVSVAFTASLGLDYALGLRSVLLVRPAATYLLTSPTRNGARGTLSAGLQVGWLFDVHRP